MRTFKCGPHIPMRRLLTILCLLSTGAIAQQPGFAKIIKGDSVVLFLTPGFNVTDSSCAANKRFVRIDEKGYFNSHFIDTNINNEPAGMGTYIYGKRHGRFETYHANGKPASKGSYADSRPVGTWEFFRENGLPERTLNFDGGDVKIIRVVDEDGDIIVNDGNGTFRGALYEPHDQRLRQPFVAKGDVLNGRPHGKWKLLSPDGRVEYKEEYDNGYFVEGRMTAVDQSSTKKYSAQPRVNSFFVPTHIETVEMMTMLRCDQIEAYEEPREQYNFDWDRFSGNLKEKIKTIVEDDVRTGRYQRQYQLGDNYLTIKFSTDKEGKPINFTQLTSWGAQFYFAFTSAIKMQTRFQPNTKEVYFHFKFSFRDGFLYSTAYGFSGSPNYYFR